MGSDKLAIGCDESTISTEGGKIIIEQLCI
jgi:hypothetical protein